MNKIPLNKVPLHGCFLTLEGGEGAGKTTNQAFITSQLDAAGIPWRATREPGGTALAEQLRILLLAQDGEAPCELAELLLLFAARAQHLEKVIKPALKAGIWVVCDRFTDATYAYQGAGRGQSHATIQTLEKLVQKELLPDMTLLLDLPVAATGERLAQRGQPRDRFEQEKAEFFQRVREGYLQRAEQEPQRFCVLDARQPLPDVQSRLKEVLQPRILAWQKEARDEP